MLSRQYSEPSPRLQQYRLHRRASIVRAALQVVALGQRLRAIQYQRVPSRYLSSSRRPRAPFGYELGAREDVEGLRLRQFFLPRALATAVRQDRPQLLISQEEEQHTPTRLR